MTQKTSIALFVFKSTTEGFTSDAFISSVTSVILIYSIVNFELKKENLDSKVNLLGCLELCK